ncbi:hypothetical protein ON010_g2011 [Phytophthora cinnamomi]|nr:hypothetical protein ON010_g2011 [Phytophthora cinnamomi]
MVTVLGPEACNEKKFTSWFEKGRALGLDWHLPAQLVSMPRDKVLKALGRLNDMGSCVRTTRTKLQKLLGSLRHMVTRIRPAAPFFQRVAALTRSAPRYRDVQVSAEAKEDLTCETRSNVFCINNVGIPLSSTHVAEALAQSSTKHYSRAWEQWSAWCNMMRYSPWLTATNIDKNAEQLGAFAGYLWKYGMNRRHQGNTYSIICAKLCAVRWYHKTTAGYDPGVNASHAILLRGIRRFSDPVVKQQPLSASPLRVIFSRLDLGRPRDQLLWGGLLLGYSS